jgi:type IV secretion system protein VirB4
MNALKALRLTDSDATIAAMLPYSHHITDSILSTVDGDYLCCWKIGGRAHECASSAEQYIWLKDLNTTLRSLATNRVSFWTHIIRKKVGSYPAAAYSNIFCVELDAQYRAGFDDKNLMQNELYLTVVYSRAAKDLTGKLARFERESKETAKARQAGSIKALEDINRQLEGALVKYDARLLKTYDHEGYAYSEVLEFLGLLLNGEKRRMPVCRNRIYEYLPVSRITFNTFGQAGEISTAQGARVFGMLTIKDYPATTQAGQFDALLESPFECILTQSFTVIAKADAKARLEKQKQLLLDSRDVAESQIEDISFALDQLISGEFIAGEHHATLAVFGDSLEQMKRNQAAAVNILSDTGVVAARSDLLLEAGYFAQLPANWKYRPRPSLVTSLNFLSFSPFHNFMTGKAHGNPWGDAVTVLKTKSGTPLYFNFHTSAADKDATDERLLGNTLVVGQSGAGKTVLLGFLLAQAQRFEPTVVVFDKDRGMDTAIRAMNGCYLPLKIGVPSGFNPFQLPLTPENKIFLKQLLKVMAQTEATGQEVLHADEREIDLALATLETLPKEQRCLSTLLQVIPNPQGRKTGAPTLHMRLSKWASGQEWGWLFDNAHDALNLETHRLYGFDVTEFLEQPEIRTPLMMYLLHRTEKMIDGRRFIYVFDEFWKMLSDPHFEDSVKNKLKTIRKQNGLCLFATQEPNDALTSSIAKTIVQQCATMVLMANPKADKEDYCSGLKLTPTEFDIVRNLPESSRRFLIKQGDNATVAGLNLAGLDEILVLLSGTPDRALIAEEIIGRVGDDPQVWIPEFLRNLGMGDADYA